MAEFRHPHIYGIDLASPSELIAHNRDRHDIAAHIGADEVIYQSLEDLRAACAKAAKAPKSAKFAKFSPPPPTPEQFEVGVFCGKYVTPVDDGYLAHLEEIRRKAKKPKVAEASSGMMVNGVASHRNPVTAVNGSRSSKEQGLHPHTDGTKPSLSTENSTAGQHQGGQEQQDGVPVVRDQMDISLHNFGDYSEPTYS